MKVLLIDVACKTGSTGKIVYDLYDQINKHGNVAAVAFGRGRKINEKNIYKFGLDFETLFHAILTRLTGFTGCFSFFSTRKLIKFIEKFKPDIVHIHEMHAYFLNVSTLLNYLKRKDIKVIHTLHCSFSYTGKCGYHMNCNKWQDNCGKCPRLNEYVSTLFFDQTQRMFLKKKKAFKGFKSMIITCPSEWLASFARNSFLNEYPITVLPNCVDTGIFYLKKNADIRIKHNIPNDYRIFLSVAPHAMSDRKGGHWILKLAKKMAQEKVAFIIVGVDNPIAECPSNVIPIGLIEDQNELSNYYSASDVFLICSSQETFSMTCAEALCCGTKVIGFKCGAPETVFKAPYAEFVDYGDIDKLMILSMESCKAYDHSLVEKYGKDEFSKENVFIRYNNLLNDLFSGK